ncbi:hypothetical protein MMC22_010958 [Lobaria immixta]|nr:hypothetical protein [Lobaria immixta]
MSLPGRRPILFEPPKLATRPGSPTKAPPGSATKRRRYLRESDDSSGELPLEKFLYRTDPYRSSSAETPLPYPLNFHPLDPTLVGRLRGDNQLHTKIRSILAEFEIESKPYEFQYQSKPNYPGGEERIAVLRVLVDVEDHVSTSNWSKARRALSQTLHDRGFDSITVEILDPARINVVTLLPIAPDHPVVALYESFREQLINEVTRSLGKYWTTLCLFSLHRPSQEPTFAVVISVRPGTVCDWPILRSKLQSIIFHGFEAKKISTPSSSIEIDFSPGNWSTLEPSTDRPGKSFAGDVLKHPKLGSSIGVSGEQGGGTLGGFFRLRCGSNMHRGFLTNYHLVAPPKSAPHIVKELATLEGTRYRPGQADDGTKSSVHYFAIKDIQASMIHCDKLISGHATAQKDAEAAILQRAEYGLEPKGALDERKARAVESQRGLELEKEKLQQLPITLGKVLVSSGRAWSVHKRILDWAFVAMDANQVNRDTWSSPGLNQLPRADAGGLYRNLPEDLVKSSPEIYNPGNPPMSINGFSRLEKGKWYFKVGRTTDITAGICHGTKIVLNISGTEELNSGRTRYDESGKCLGLSKPVGFIEEYLIVSSKPGQDAAQQRDFCDSGDSGALIINAVGEVAGLLFARYSGQTGHLVQQEGWYPGHLKQQDEWYYGAGIATTMPDVLESIAMRTTPRDASGKPTGPPGQLLLP